MTRRYQFCVDGRAAAFVRQSWHDAARDAVGAGYAVWQSKDSIRLADGAAIERIDRATPIDTTDAGREG